MLFKTAVAEVLHELRQELRDADADAENDMPEVGLVRPAPESTSSSCGPTARLIPLSRNGSWPRCGRLRARRGS